MAICWCRTWHVLVPDCDLHGAVGEAVALLRRAGVIYSTLDNVWKAIVYADVSPALAPQPAHTRTSTHLFPFRVMVEFLPLSAGRPR